MAAKNRAKVQVDKENVKLLYSSVFDRLNDVLYALELYNGNNHEQIKQIIIERVEEVQSSMNKVWNPVIRDLKEEQKVLYGMYEKNKDNASGVGFYKEYLTKKKMIEAYERGEIDI